MRDARRRFRRIAAKNQAAPIGERREEVRIGFDELQAVLCQPELAEDGRRRLRSMGQRGNAKPRIQLFGDGRAAYDGAALEHERLETRLGDAACGNKTVVAGADEDDVVAAH